MTRAGYSPLDSRNEMRTTIMTDDFGRIVGRMRASDVAGGAMEWRTTPKGHIQPSHIRRASRARALSARLDEGRTGVALRRIYP